MARRATRASSPAAQLVLFLVLLLASFLVRELLCHFPWFRRANMLQLVRDTHEALSAAGVAHTLCCGSLMGEEKEGAILPWDYDTDMYSAPMTVVQERVFLDELAARGVRFDPSLSTRDCYFRTIAGRWDDMTDVYMVSDDDGDGRWSACNRCNPGCRVDNSTHPTYDADVLWPPRPCTMGGVDFTCPNDAGRLLDLKYRGPQWRRERELNGRFPWQSKWQHVLVCYPLGVPNAVTMIPLVAFMTYLLRNVVLAAKFDPVRAVHAPGPFLAVALVGAIFWFHAFMEVFFLENLAATTVGLIIGMAVQSRAARAAPPGGTYLPLRSAAD